MIFAGAAFYATLFITSFLSATIVPLSPDALAAFMAVKGYSLLFIIAAASTGSYFGSCTTYFLGFYGGEKALKGENKEKIDKYKSIFGKYGAPMLLFSWIPIIGDAFVALSGVFKINFWIFSFYAMLGKIIRFAFVAYAAERFL